MKISYPWAVHTALLVLMLGLTGFPLGCGGSGEAQVHPVRGEVFLNGKPAGGAVVHLHPRDKEKGRPAFATVQEDGVFYMTTLRDKDGALAGEYVVTIIWRDERIEDGEIIAGRDKFNDRYSRFDASELKATVQPGKNELPRFDLH